MKSFSILTAAIVMGTIITGCHHLDNKQQTNNANMQAYEIPDPAHHAENSLDWNGRYLGTLPCADCPGIKITLTLNLDKTYHLEETYLERNVQPLITQGIFQFDKANTSIIVLDDAADNRRFFIGEGFAEARAMDGTAINGPLKSHYQLQKIN